MRVLLVHPPFQIFRNMRNTDFPLGLGYIAAILKLDGHDVVIYNGEYGSSYAHITNISDRLGTSKKAIENLEAQPYRDFKKAIDSFGPDVVGMSVYSQSYKAAVNLSKIVKASFRDCLVVVGGPHVTVAPDSLMEIPSIDVAVMFEGEYAMQQIIRNFANHKRTFENIPGVIFKYNGVVNRNKPAKRIDNLDLLPFPVRNVYLGDIVNLTPSQKRLFIKRNNSVMITSRGCPYACKFCSCKNIWARKVTFRSIESVIDELRVFYDSYGSSEMMFCDDAFSIRRGRVMDFCKAYVASGIPIPWKAQTRVNLVDYDLLKAMRDAGCSTIYFGIESGSQTVLDIIDKKITVEQVYKAVEATERAGLTWACSFVFGIPGETVEDMMKTLDLMKQIHPSNMSLLSFTPFPGTEFYHYESVKAALPSFNYYDVELFSEPRNFTGTMSDEQFNAMKQLMFGYVDRHNSTRSSFSALKEKVRNPVYLKHPIILLNRAWEKAVHKDVLQGW